MTKTQKILLVVAGGVGFLLLASRTRSASASTGISYPPAGSGEEPAAVPVRQPPSGPPDATVLFAHDSSAIPLVSGVQLNRTLSSNQWMHAELHGYASSEGGAQYNLALTERRNATVGAGIQERIPGITVESFAHGEGDPKADNSTEAGRAQNRRTDVYLYLTE